MIERLAIIGQGNVGTYLSRQFEAKGIKVDRYSREASAQAKALSDYHAAYDLSLICVPDSQIQGLSESLAEGVGILAHSSGTMPLDTLSAKHQRRAIFYPLMSLKAESDIALETIPFCLETHNPSDRKALEDFAQNQSLHFKYLDSKDRAQVHLAAVISQNFSNHLYHQAWRILRERDLDFQILKPLLENHIKQLSNSDPSLKQTGPAVRKDQQTIDQQLAKLQSEDLKSLYQVFTRSIQKTDEEKL